MPRPSSEWPEAFRALRAEDEKFWQEQERNIQGALGQPCCTLSGISSGLLRMRGNFALVIHGEDECAACFRHIGPGTVNLFCTGLTEQEFVTGRTSEPLTRCLEAVCDEVKPEGIFVLGACPVEVIGDRFETVVEKVAKRYPHIPMVALHTSGLKVGTQTAMLDWMFEQLASLPSKAPQSPAWRQELGRGAIASLDRALGVRADAPDLPAPPTLTSADLVAMIGLPPFHPRGRLQPEYADVLTQVGLHLLANFPQAASFDDWRALTLCGATFVADKSLYPKLTRVLERSGPKVAEIPLPIGVGQSDRFYGIIAETTGRQAAFEAALAPRRERAEAALAAFRARFGGIRIAYGLRMNNNYNADELAYQGLGDLPALQEMGFDITLMVQGPPDKREKFGQMFERRGIDLKFEMFAEPWILGDLLKAGDYGAAVLADFARNEAQKAGIPMIPVRRLEACYAGVSDNAALLERLLTQVR